MNHKRYYKGRFLRQSIVLAILCLIAVACNPRKQQEAFNSLSKEISQRFAPDTRTAVLNIDIEETTKGAVVLRGETNLREAYDFLLDTLASMNVQVVDSIKLLPASGLGDKTWGFVTLSVIPMRSAPGYSAEMVSQAILGTPVKLLDKKGGWYRVQTPDLYIGWVPASGLEPMTESEIAVWKTSDRFVYTPMNGWLLAGPKDDAANVADLVLGSIFVVDGRSKGFLHVLLPDKREGFVKESDCMKFTDWENIQPSADNVIQTAKKLLGSPYLWGGTSTKGIDCSGFVKTAYFSQGVMLARDASQQARYGETLAIDSLDFQPGDLLFFGRNKDHITHVGLYIGQGHFIHSSGRVKINSFNPDDPDFDPGRREQLVTACRVLNSLNREQIIQIKNHPWYN
jgi:SH3-like domain-containing protein